MLLQKGRFPFWFNIKKLARTSTAVGFFVFGLIATFNYIRIEASAVAATKNEVLSGKIQKTYRNPLEGPESKTLDDLSLETREGNQLQPLSGD